MLFQRRPKSARVPHATFLRLRNESPVSFTEEHDGRGFWSITRHDDVLFHEISPLERVKNEVVREHRRPHLLPLAEQAE